MGLPKYEQDAFDNFTVGMKRRLVAFAEGGYMVGPGARPRTMEGAVRSDSLWLLMRAKRNLDRFIDAMVDRQGHPSANDLYDASNLMSLADALMRGVLPDRSTP